MDDKIREAVESWLGQAVSVKERQTRTVHLDQLGLKRKRYETALLDFVFRAGIRSATSLPGHWRIVLVLALMPSRSLRLERTRTIESYVTRQSDMEPPSIYLLAEGETMGCPREEEYRFPLAHHVPGLDPEQYQVLFRQVRPETEIPLDDVFYDDVWYEQLP